MKSKFRIGKGIVLLMIMMLMILIPGRVQANVQSRGDKASLNYKNVQQFFELIREMETSSGPMGLSATIEQGTKNGGTTILEKSDSNNIDVHMIKNTEWGTVAMLMDSAYGSKFIGEGCNDNGKNLVPEINRTTTGNTSGVYQFFSGIEYVSGMSDYLNNNNMFVYYADNKYWDKYTEEKGKVGDATLECTTNNNVSWKNRNDGSRYQSSDFITNYGNTANAFGRGNGSRGAFYFGVPMQGGCKEYQYVYSRAAVVNGTGF